MAVILYLGTGSAYIRLKGLFMLSTNKIQGIFQYLAQFKIYFSRTFRPFNNRIANWRKLQAMTESGGKLSEENKLTSKKRSHSFNILPKKVGAIS